MSSYLGQNFLVDIQIQEAIMKHLCDMREQYKVNSILEIGPGKGALTQHIIKIFEHIILVEKDESLLAQLKKFSSRAKLIFEDILKYDIQDIDPQTIIYGSLPYYITSPIIQKFFVQSQMQHGCFIVQKEFGEKISSLGKHKSYLWRLLNYRYDISYIQTIAAQAFDPAPKVQSCIISIDIKKQALMSKDEFERLRILIEALGTFKRKTLHKSFKLLGGISLVLQGCNYILPPDLYHKRLEECTYDDINRMYQQSV